MKRHAPVESPSVRLMDNMLEQGADVDFLDPHIEVISTNHDAVDYGVLADLGIPVIDTRNAFASRGLSMEHVTKA